MAFLKAFVVVEFDVDVGQKPIFQYPADALSADDAKKIAYLALPDSNSSVSHDVIYTFRFRSDEVPLLASTASSHSYTYGFSFFRQRRDASVRRGFVQKSLVIATDQPFIGLFKDIVRIVGSVFFDLDAAIRGESDRAPEAAIIAAFHEMSRWPHPVPGVTYSLPLMGVKLDFTAPYSSLEVFDTRTTASAGQEQLRAPALDASAAFAGSESVSPTFLGSTSEPAAAHVSLHDVMAAKSIELPGMFQEIGLYTVFRDMVPCLWHLWQIALTGEPLMIMGSSPEACGDAVLGIVSLISPLSYCADFRPYFTLYDPDFQSLSRVYGSTSVRAPRNPSSLSTTSAAAAVGESAADLSTANSPLLIGTTNPFFVKALDQWPNALWLGAKQPSVSARIAGEADTSSPRSPATRGPRGYKAADANVAVLGGKTIVGTLPQPGEEAACAPILVVQSAPLIQPDVTVLSQLLRINAADETGDQLRLGGVRLPDSPAAPGSTSPREVAPGVYFDRVSCQRTGSVVPGVMINNGVLRQHFRLLTHAFLKPFERYFHLSKRVSESIVSHGAIGGGTAVTPSLSEVMAAGTSLKRSTSSTSSAKSTHKAHHANAASHDAVKDRPKVMTHGPYDDLMSQFLPPFEETSFLSFLESSGGPKHALLKAADWRTLYSRFINSCHFRPWFNARRRAVAARLFSYSRSLRLAVGIEDLLPPSPYVAALTPSADVDSMELPRPAVAGSSTGPDSRPMTRFTREDAQKHEAECVRLHHKIVSTFVREAPFLSSDEELLRVMRAHFTALQSAMPKHLRASFQEAALKSSSLIASPDSVAEDK